MSRSLRARVAVLAVIGLVAASACGDDTRPLSEQFGSLSPGRYATDRFQPALSFEVGKGWEVSELRQEPYFEIAREYQGGSYFAVISFNNPPGKVSDPRKPGRLLPAPKTGSHGSRSTRTSKLRVRSR